MSEDPQATPSPSQGDTKPDAIDTSKFVPKEEFEKALNGKESELGNLKRSLEEAQTALTSPEYLKFIAAKRSNSDDTAKESSSPDAAQQKIASLEMAVSQMAAMLELQQVEQKYSDFNDLRSDVQTLIQANGNLSFEQAYLIAKQQKAESAPKPTEPKKEVKGTEKPGTFIPDPNEVTKEFKSADEASADAAKQIKEKYNIVGDTL